MKLTNDFLKNVSTTKDRDEFRDDDEPRLSFRVTKNGAKSWSLRYVTKSGEHRRKTIGRYPDIGLARARVLVRQIKGDVAEKIDVVGREKEEKAEIERQKLNRLDTLADEYFAACEIGTHRLKGKPKRPDVLSEEKRHWENHVKPEFGERPVTSITRQEIAEFVERETKAAPSRGRHCYTLIRQLMSYALLKEIIPANIALKLPTVAPTERERVLTDDELRKLWTALRGSNDRKLTIEMRLAMCMALLTMQRGKEVTGMRWSEIDREQKTWTIPAARMKGKRPHCVPLSDMALQLLAEAENRIGGSVYVFQSSQSEEAMPIDRHSFTRAFNRLAKNLEIPDATPHDFRRTGSTNITSERMRKRVEPENAVNLTRFITGRILAHKDDSVTAKHYDKNEYLAEKRVALDAWAGMLQDIVSPIKLAA